MITIFTDGSSKGNPGPGGWGAIVAYEKNEKSELRSKNHEWVTELGGRGEHTTNNRMELAAVIQALAYLDSSFITHDSITLHTDSEYIVKGITEWVNGWQRNNWRTAAKKPVLNQELWQELLSVVSGKKIKWVVVKGHSGVPANERCDLIATTFADNAHFELYSGLRSDYFVSFQAHGAFI
ncbi:ribonuclease HI [soil metagenome]